MASSPASLGLPASSWASPAGCHRARCSPAARPPRGHDAHHGGRGAGGAPGGERPAAAAAGPQAHLFRERGAPQDPPHDGARDGDGGAEAVEGREGDDRAVDREGVLLRLRHAAARGQGPAARQEGDGQDHPAEAAAAPRGGERGGGGAAHPRGRGAVQARDPRGDPRARPRRADHAVPHGRDAGHAAAPVVGPVRRPARRAHRDAPQRCDRARVDRRGVLARRRVPPDAAADLRDGVADGRAARRAPAPASRRRSAETTVRSGRRSTSSRSRRTRAAASSSGTRRGRRCGG